LGGADIDLVECSGAYHTWSDGKRFLPLSAAAVFPPMAGEADIDATVVFGVLPDWPWKCCVKRLLHQLTARACRCSNC
jgi:hypothetical protein